MMYFKNITFTGLSNTFSSTTAYKIMVPIVWENLTSGNITKTGQNFNHLYLENIKFVNLKTKGYGVMLKVNSNTNNIYRLSAKNCGFYSCRQFSSSNQVFSSSLTIEPTGSLFTPSSFSNINSMVEENTMIK